MSAPIKNVNDKLDTMADHAKAGAHKAVERVVDSASDVAHAVAEKAREGAKKAGEKLSEAGEKISKLAK